MENKTISQVKKGRLNIVTSILLSIMVVLWAIIYLDRGDIKSSILMIISGILSNITFIIPKKISNASLTNKLIFGLIELIFTIAISIIVLKNAFF